MTDRSYRSAWGSAGGAAGLSAIASVIGLCCVGPWAVAVLGVSGAVVMARYAFLRPWLLVLASVLLAWGFYRVYRPRQQCADGTCPGAPSWWLQAALWLALLLIVIAFFAPELLWLIVDPMPAGGLPA